jgi:hypothetical protein
MSEIRKATHPDRIELVYSEDYFSARTNNSKCPI